MEQVKWSQIEAECGDFRAGFVATFKKYEGQETDETDAQNKPVKVTVASFARHTGIAERTFRYWVNQGGRRLRDEPRDRTREEIKRMPPERKRELASELVDGLPPDERAEIAKAAVKGIDSEGRSKVVKAVYDEAHREMDDDPAARRARGKAEETAFDLDARKCVRRAFAAIGDRIHVYGDVPLDEWETQTLGHLQRMVDSLVRGVEMDDDLKEMLDEQRA